LKYDPLQEIFDSIDPVKDLSDAQLEALHPTASLLERLHDEITEDSVSWIRRSIWRRTVIISATTVLVLAGTAAAITILRSSVQATTSLSCFRADSLSSGADVVAYSEHPLSVCQSFLHWSPMPSSPSPEGSLCVLSNGSLAGFPPSRESQVCAKLDLPIFNGRVKNPEIAAFQRAAQRYFSQNSCMLPAVAQAGVQRLIGKYGISNWYVRVSGSREQSACAILAIEVKSRTVDIVGISR
jgi:hypothetical protein